MAGTLNVDKNSNALSVLKIIAAKMVKKLRVVIIMFQE